MRAVLYDFDGLLIDSETAGLLSWKRVYAEFGQELDLAHWLCEIEAGRGPCMPTERLAELVAEPVDWEAVERRRIGWRDELLILRPGAVRHLEEARRLGFATAIVSNAPDWWIGQRMDSAGIGPDSFDVIVCKAEGLARKPAPDAYLAALRELGCAAGDALAYEDSPAGIRAALAAGIRCVAVPNMVTAHFDLSAADLVLPSLDARPLAEVAGALLAAGHPGLRGRSPGGRSPRPGPGGPAPR
ncbi:HAD-IA family hydrolase [Streptomyces sp. NPDC003077]|uniref:HAD family hydrolase n=1 Tax=Streptomyces sp. NPDC003077 TaxID=3154443 RepID=UPI00339EC1BB